MISSKNYSVKDTLDVLQVHTGIWEVLNISSVRIIGKILISIFFSCIVLSLCLFELIVLVIFVKITLAFAGQRQRFHSKSQFANFKLLSAVFKLLLTN